MYTQPLQIRSDDPVCSATTLGNTVVGILFEKTGAEIRAAIEARIQAIREEEQTYRDLVSPLGEFLRRKEKEIEEVKIIEEQRLRARSEALRDVRRCVRQAESRLQEAHNKLDETEDKFDSETRAALGEHEDAFGVGWDDFKDRLHSINSFLQDEKWSTTSSSPVVSSTSASSTLSCSSNSYNGDYDPDREDGFSKTLSFNEVKVSVSAKLEQRLHRYMAVFDKISSKLKELELERRQLELIAYHINPERSFKLDITKLSAFGFEEPSPVEKSLDGFATNLD